RNNKDVVLSRLCFKTGVQVIGGASKLIKHSISDEGYQKVITWSDNRWSNGKVYPQCGFVLDKELGPDYCYIKNGIMKPKQSMKKKSIKCPPNMTEKEYCESLG